MTQLTFQTTDAVVFRPPVATVPAVGDLRGHGARRGCYGRRWQHQWLQRQRQLADHPEGQLSFEMRGCHLLLHDCLLLLAVAAGCCWLLLAAASLKRDLNDKRLPVNESDYQCNQLDVLGYFRI